MIQSSVLNTLTLPSSVILERVLVIHPHLDIKGGSERLTRILVNELVKRGFDVHIVTGRIDFDWFHGKFTVHLIPDEVKSPDSVIEFISTVVKDVKPDFVIDMIQESYFLHGVKKVSKDILTCMYVHFPIDEEIDEKKVESYRKLRRYPQLTIKYLDDVDLMFANSRRTALVTELVWGSRPIVVYPSLDEVFFIEKPPLEVERDKVIIYVGRFVILKRQDTLILMFKFVKEKVPEAKLLLVGTADPRHLDYLEHVKDVADKVKDVELIHSVKDEELIKYYRLAKVYVHPRIGEHFGLAPIEAMSQGTPPIIHSTCGVTEVTKHGVDAFFAKSDVEIIKYMIHVLKMDRDTWFKLQKAAYETSQFFKPQRFCDEILKYVVERIEKKLATKVAIPRR